jgi:hypothetical protein
VREADPSVLQRVRRRLRADRGVHERGLRALFTGLCGVRGDVLHVADRIDLRRRIGVSRLTSRA